MAQQLKKWLLNATRVLLVQQQIFVSKIHVKMTIEIIFLTFLIVSFIVYCIRNSLLYMPIHKVLLNFLQYQLFLSLTVLTVTILFIVNLFLIVLDIQILYVTISTITPVSAIAQFYLFLFPVAISYQNLLILSLQYFYQVGLFYQLPISGLSFSIVIITATPLSYFYQHT